MLFRKGFFCLAASIVLGWSPACFAQPGPIMVNGVWQHNAQTSNDRALRYYRKGLLLCRKAKMKDAIVELDDAIKLEPNCAEFYFKRGDCFLELIKYKEAYADFTKAIQLEPKHFPAYKRRARLNYERGNYDDAIKDYDKALQATPNKSERAEIVKQKAKMHSYMKKYDLAVQELTQSIALERAPHTLMLRGNQYFSMKQYKKAIDDYSEAIKFNSPKLQDRLFTMRADAYEKVGRFDLAKKDRKSAKELVDDSWGSVLQDMDKQTSP